MAIIGGQTARITGRNGIREPMRGSKECTSESKITANRGVQRLEGRHAVPRTNVHRKLSGV